MAIFCAPGEYKPTKCISKKKDTPQKIVKAETKKHLNHHPNTGVYLLVILTYIGISNNLLFRENAQ